MTLKKEIYQKLPTNKKNYIADVLKSSINVFQAICDFNIVLLFWRPKFPFFIVMKHIWNPDQYRYSIDLKCLIRILIRIKINSTTLFQTITQ